MTLNIKDPETDQLVRLLASETGESITQAVATAVRERLDRISGSRTAPDLKTEMKRIAGRIAQLPILDARTPDEILGYDHRGLSS